MVFGSGLIMALRFGDSGCPFNGIGFSLLFSKISELCVQIDGLGLVCFYQA